MASSNEIRKKKEHTLSKRIEAWAVDCWKQKREEKEVNSRWKRHNHFVSPQTYSHVFSVSFWRWNEKGKRGGNQNTKLNECSKDKYKGFRIRLISFIGNFSYDLRTLTKALGLRFLKENGFYASRNLSHFFFTRSH